MNIFAQFFDEYASTVLYTALTAIIGGVGVIFKQQYEETVRAVSQTLAGKEIYIAEVETMLRIEAEQIEERKGA